MSDKLVRAGLLIRPASHLYAEASILRKQSQAAVQCKVMTVYKWTNSTAATFVLVFICVCNFMCNLFYILISNSISFEIPHAAQLPQLLKILWRGSAKGLNVTAVLLQLYAFSCPVIYAMSNNFPFL